MGTKVFFTGLAIIIALPIVLKALSVNFTNLDLIGAIVAIIGIVLLWLDR